ncbi:hypothetical protein D3C78_1759340 [compost metagenome]
MPMLPAAPGRFSTTIVAPVSRANWVVIRRDRTSGDPPAADGTMNVMGLSG